MDKSRNKSLRWGLLFCSALFSSTALAELGVFRQLSSFKSPRGEVGLRTQYLTATYNYDPQGGSFTKLGDGNSYTLFETDIGARLNLWDHVAFFGSGRIAASESKTQGIRRSNSALSQFTIGAEYELDAGGLSWIPQVSLTIPVTNLDFTVDKVAVGEGVTTFTALMKGQVRQKSWYLDSGVGISFRDKKRSTLMPFNVGAHVNLARSFSIGMDLSGSTTVFKENEGDLARHAWACTYNGCARRFGSVNPTILELTGALQIRTSPRFLLRLDAGSSITGSAIGGGPIVAVGINYMFGLGSRSGVVPHTFEEEKLEQEFIPETNSEVDHDQFVAPAADQIQTLQSPTAPPPPRRNKDLLQNELDKTEMQIELRSNKKKK